MTKLNEQILDYKQTNRKIQDHSIDWEGGMATVYEMNTKV